MTKEQEYTFGGYGKLSAIVKEIEDAKKAHEAQKARNFNIFMQEVKKAYDAYEARKEK